MSSLKDYALNVVTIAIVILVFFGILVFVGGRAEQSRRTDDARQIKQEETKIAELEQVFSRDVEEAKRATSDPCAALFYQLVVPPAGLDRPTKLIMMGQVLYHDPDNLSLYILKPNGDKVELWERFLTQARFGSEKVGEKFALDSPRCTGE